MTKYLFILVAVLALVVGCNGEKGGTETDTYPYPDDGCNGLNADCGGSLYDRKCEGNKVYECALSQCGSAFVLRNDCEAMGQYCVTTTPGSRDAQCVEELPDGDTLWSDDGDDETPDTNDNYVPDDECPNGTGSADCSTRSLCPSGPYGWPMCKGDMLLQCVPSTDPCWDGTFDDWFDCAEAGERCFSTEEEGCGGSCRPLADFKPAASFEGQWREIEEPGYTGNTIEYLSFPASNEVAVRWSGDAQTYTGAYENSQIGGYLTTRWSFNAPYAVTTFCDYRILLDGDTITLKFMANTGYWDDCLSYMGENWQNQNHIHIFERIPEEQPDDDSLLSDTN